MKISGEERKDSVGEASAVDALVSAGAHVLRLASEMVDWPAGEPISGCTILVWLSSRLGYEKIAELAKKQLAGALSQADVREALERRRIPSMIADLKSRERAA